MNGQVLMDYLVAAVCQKLQRAVVFLNEKKFDVM